MTYSRIFSFGKVLSKVKTDRKFRRVLSVVIVLLLAVFSFLPNLSLAANIGGIPVINISTPVSKVETATKVAVQVPVEVNYISRGYSWFHSGMDLVADSGKPVYTVMDGEVKLAQTDWFGYGNHVIIDHGAGFGSLYGHLSKIEVKVGDKVTLKTELGKVGSTGFSTGPHLHLEIYQDGKTIDPAEILPNIVVK